MFKFINSNEKNYILNYITKNNKNYCHETRNINNLLIPFFRLDLCQKSILYCGPNLWNTLNKEIKENGLKIFKKK